MLTLIVIGITGFLLLTLQQKVYQNLWMKNLTVRVGFTSDHIFEGETGTLRETIENRKRLPLAMLKVKFTTDRHLVFGNAEGSRTTDHYYRNDVFCVGGGERVIRTLKFKGIRRGYYAIEDLNFSASDLFFMYQMNVEAQVPEELQQDGTRRHIYVYPRPYDSRRLRQALIALNGDMVSKRYLLEDPFAYRGIREYQPYDDLRSINWKATAKTGDFKVNQRHYTSLKSARVFFDIQSDYTVRQEDAVEMTLRLSAALCACLLKQGLEVSCYGNGTDIADGGTVAVSPRAGVLQMDHIYKTLARVDAGQPAVSFVQKFENMILEDVGETLTCFVAPCQHSEFISLLSEYQKRGTPFLWFYPVQDGKPLPSLPPALSKSICVLYLDM